MKFDAVHNEIELTDADLQAVYGGDAGGSTDAVGTPSSLQAQNGGLLDLLAATVSAIANIPVASPSSGIGSLGSSTGGTTTTRNAGE